MNILKKKVFAIFMFLSIFLNLALMFLILRINLTLNSYEATLIEYEILVEKLDSRGKPFVVWSEGFEKK